MTSQHDKAKRWRLITISLFSLSGVGWIVGAIVPWVMIPAGAGLVVAIGLLFWQRPRR